MSSVEVSIFKDRATGDPVEAKYIVHGSAKSWANLDGTGTIALRDSLNVSSVVDNGVGDYGFSFTNAMATDNYTVAGTCGNSIGAASTGTAIRPYGELATALVINTHALTGVSVFTFDPTRTYLQVHGDLA